MNIKDYNWLQESLPKLGYNDIEDYYKEAMENEGCTNTILSINWNNININVENIYFPKYLLILIIEDCGVKTEEMGWEELGEVTLGYSLKDKKWNIMF